MCVDEQIGHLSIKQYSKDKPYPWGIKVFSLCGASGIMYNFILYEGSTTEFNECIVKDFGQGAAVVFKLMVRVPCNAGHTLFFDNYFTSYNLLEICAKRGIGAAGTIRVNRFANPPLLSDKDWKKKKGKTVN